VSRAWCLATMTLRMIDNVYDITTIMNIIKETLAKVVIYNLEERHMSFPLKNIQYDKHCLC